MYDCINRCIFAYVCVCARVPLCATASVSSCVRMLICIYSCSGARVCVHRSQREHVQMCTSLWMYVCGFYAMVRSYTCAYVYVHAPILFCFCPRASARLCVPMHVHVPVCAFMFHAWVCTHGFLHFCVSLCVPLSPSMSVSPCVHMCIRIFVCRRGTYWENLKFDFFRSFTHIRETRMRRFTYGFMILTY